MYALFKLGDLGKCRPTKESGQGIGFHHSTTRILGVHKIPDGGYTFGGIDVDSEACCPPTLSKTRSH